MTVQPLRLGLSTFGDLGYAPDGSRLTQAQTIRTIVEQAEIADRSGVSSFSLGEHHRPDFAVTNPGTVLAAIASRTEQIRLGTSVTVLSSDDPVRVFEQFSTLSALSEGRAEITLGRGSFTESFPLFGYDLADYEMLFDEKLDLFEELLKERPVSWQGRTRRPLANASVYPKTEHGLEAWVGVGGTPASVVRTARHGMNLMLAIIGGGPERFQPLVYNYYRESTLAGHSPGLVGAYSAGYVADTDEQAVHEAFDGFQATARQIGGERGWAGFTRERFMRDSGPGGSTYVGSPETVAQKIAGTVRTLGLNRFDLNYGTASGPSADLNRSVELFGTQVMPRVYELLAESHHQDLTGPAASGHHARTGANA